MKGNSKWTPAYFHCLDPEFRTNVYEPEADSFLFLEALDIEGSRICHRHPKRCLEIGCGSGILISYLWYILTQSDNYNIEDSTAQKVVPIFHAVDINPIALRCTEITWKSTVTYNNDSGSAADVLVLHQGNLFSPFGSSSSPNVASICGKNETNFVTQISSSFDNGDSFFDVILFNPPYVPTSKEELESTVDSSKLLNAAWCGGPKGRVVINSFLEELPYHLSVNGLCYLLIIRENEIDDLINFTESAFNKAGRTANVKIVSEKYTGEWLMVLCITAKD